MTTILIAYQEQAWTSESAFLASSTAPAERVLIWMLDTGRAYLGDGTTLPAALTPVIEPGIPFSYLDTDTTLAADSDTRIASQHAVKAFISGLISGVLHYQGGIDCSANPNYPAASKGDMYAVTVAGRIGGASGTSVDIGDSLIANTDNAGGTEAAVGADWNHFEHNLVGAVLAANNGSDFGDLVAFRSNVGLAIGTNVQAWDADLDTYATKPPPGGDVVGTTDVQALTHKDLTDATNVFPSFPESQVTNLTTDLAAKVPTSRQVASGTGLTGGGDLSADRTFAVSYGTTAGTAAQGNDSRLSDARTPTAHASSHAAAGSDPVTIANTQVTGLGTASTHAATDFDASGAAATAQTNAETYADSTASTLTNKRKKPRVFSTTSTSTLTPEIDTYDAFTLTAQAAALTIANHSTSTPADFEQIRIRILDNGTARAISFGTNYVARAGVSLPTTTTISKLLEMGFEWNNAISKWVLMAAPAES